MKLPRTPEQKALQNERTYELASLIAVKYGWKGANRNHYKQEHINELWKYGHPYPSLSKIVGIGISEVKWYIHNRLNMVQDDIWNSDFVMGITAHGSIKYWNRTYPTFMWLDNKNITDLIKACPFGGRILTDKPYNRYPSVYGKWANVPALYLKYSDKSASYMAGFFCAAKLIEIDGVQYAYLSERASKVFKNWNIPFDETRKRGRLISPIWPALFTPKMPVEFRSRWLNLDNPYGTDTYAPILWKTYVNSLFTKGGIPYLKCRRTVYYHFKKGEDNLTTCLNKLRIEKNMTEIDNRVKEMVDVWAKKPCIMESKESNEQI